jgi:hypothetical protein
MRFRLPLALFGLLIAATLAGCSSESASTVDEKQFATLFKDDQTYTDVMYMGSDGGYDYFCMEHWTIQPDGSDGKLDKRNFYRVMLTNQHVKDPFPLTYDENKWRVMRPTLHG